MDLGALCPYCCWIPGCQRQRWEDELTDVPPALDLSRLCDQELAVTKVRCVLGHVCHQGAFGGEVSLHGLDAYKRLSLKRGIKTMVHPRVDSCSVHTAV